jgi:acyl dehydratase
MSGQPYLGDVEAGLELPPLVKQPTTRQLAMYAGASGDFYEIHYDKDFAIEQGLPGVILHGALKSAFLAQVVTGWMGPGGRLVSFAVRYREMDVPGDTLTCGGAVTSTDAAAGTVACELWIENGEGKRTTTGEAVVALPSHPG